MNLKKILALVLVFTMVLSFVPTYAFAEDEGIELFEEEVFEEEAPEEGIVEEDPQDEEPIVEITDETDEEPAAEPAAEDTSAEPAGEEVSEEEPAPTEEEPAEEPEEEEELEAVTSTVEDTETLEKFVAFAKIGDAEYGTLQEAINEAGTGSYGTEIELIDNVAENIQIGKAVTINAAGKTITGTVSATTTDVAFTATINGATITGDVTVTGTDEDHAATLTLNNVTLGVNSKLTLTNYFSKATLTGCTVKNTADGSITANGLLTITSGNFSGHVKGTVPGNVTGGTFNKIDKILIKPGYTTADYSTDYADATWCTGTVTATSAKALLATVTNVGGAYGKYYDTATDAFKAELAGAPFVNAFVYLTAPYGEETFKLADDQKLTVFDDENGYGDELERSLQAETDGYTIYAVETTGLITYKVNTGYEARIGTTGYETFGDAFAVAYGTDNVIEVLATPTTIGSDKLVMSDGKAIKVKIVGSDFDIATVTDLLKTKETSGYSISKSYDAASEVWTLKHVANNYSITPSGGETQYFTTLNDAIASVTTNSNVTVKTEITTDIATATVPEGKNITLNLNGKDVTLRGPVTVEEGATFEIDDNSTSSKDFYMAGDATFAIADKAALTLRIPVKAEGIQKLATITGEGTLTTSEPVVIENGKDGIKAEEKSRIGIGSDFTATLTGTAFDGGQYTIMGDVSIEGCATGFNKATAIATDSNVKIDGTGNGIVNSDFVLMSKATLDAGKGFDIGADNRIVAIGTAKLATTTGLTASITKNTETTFSSKFATVAALAEAENPGNTVELLATPASDDVFTFTDAAFSLKVKAADGVTIPTDFNWSTLVNAYSDSQKPPKAIEDTVDASGVHTLSQVEFHVSLRNKGDNTAVAGFTSFKEAMKTTSYDPDTQYFMIVDNTGAVTDVEIPATFSKVYLKKDVKANNSDLLGAKPTELYQFVKGTDGNAPYAEGGYTVYEQEPKQIKVTWNANGGKFYDGTAATSTIISDVTVKTQVEELETKPTMDAKFFKGWAATNSNLATDGDLIKFPITDGLTTPTTFYAQWTPAVATLTDLGGYVHNFGSVKEAYEFLTADEHAEWFNETSVITLCGDAGNVYLDDFVPTGESLKLKKDGKTADVKLRNQKVPSATSLVPYEAGIYTFVTTSTDLTSGVTTYTVGQYTAQLQTVVSESTKGNNGNWSEFQVTSTSYTIIKDFNDLDSEIKGYVTKKDDETSQKKTRTEKTIIFLTDNPATRTDLYDRWFAATGTKLRVDPNGHKDNFKVPTGECITPTNESGVDVYTWATYTVTLDGNGGDPATKDVTVRAKETVTTRTNVTKHGYTWTAWATSTDTAAPAIDLANTPITENQTWYAKWEPKTVYYTFVATATELATPVTTQTTISGQYDADTELNIATSSNLKKIKDDIEAFMENAGFKVSGWTLDGAAVALPDKFTYEGTNTNVKYVATLEPITYEVTLYGNGGTPDTQTQSVEKAVARVSTATNVYTEPVRENYIFQGWVVGTPTNTNIYATVTNIRIATKTDLYAKWTGKPVNFTFTTTPTSIATPTEFKNKAYGTEVTTTTGLVEINKMIKAIEANGYQFNGWTLNGEAVATPTKFESAVGTDTNIYVANVTPMTYTIVLDGNGGMVNKQQKYEITGTRDQVIDISIASPTDAKYVKAVKGNYVFDGWATPNNLTTATNVDIKGKTFFEVGNATYKAVYTAGEVTLEFSDPLSTWTNTLKVMAGATPTEIKKNNKYEEPTRDGYKFNGWNPALANADVNASYEAQWLKEMNVDIILGEVVVKTVKATESNVIQKPDGADNWKIDGKPVKWLINGVAGRFFEFDKTLAPVDIVSLVATATEPEAGKINITWTNNDGSELLHTQTEDAPYTPKTTDWLTKTPTWSGEPDGLIHTFDGWTMGTDTNVYNDTAKGDVKAFVPVNADTTFKAHFATSDHDEVYKRQLALGDSIVMRWIIAQTATGADRSKYKVTIEGDETEYTGDILFNGKLVIGKFTAQEMTKEAKVTVFYDNDVIANLVYTIDEYCRDLEGNNDPAIAKWHNVMKAVQDYGYMAQVYYKSTAVKPYGDGDQIADEAIPKSEPTKTANTTIGISNVRFRLYTEAQTVLSVAFVHDSGKTFDDYVFTVEQNGTTRTLTKDEVVDNGKYFEIRVGGIPAKELDKTVKVIAAAKENTNQRAYFEGSAVSYMYTAYNNPKATQDLKNMISALYTYHYYAKQAQG